MKNLRLNSYRAGIQAGQILLWLGIAAVAYGALASKGTAIVVGTIVIAIDFIALRILNGALKIDMEKEGVDLTNDSTNHA